MALRPAGSRVPHGVARSSPSRCRPINAGWYAGDSVWESIYGPRMQLAADARRFDVSPAWLDWVGAASAIRTFAEADLGAVHDHGVGLADRAARRTRAASPAGSAIVSLEDPDGSLLDRFGEAGLSTAGRAGRVRIGFHVWNDEDDLARVLDVVRGRRRCGDSTDLTGADVTSAARGARMGTTPHNSAARAHGPGGRRAATSGAWTERNVDVAGREDVGPILNGLPSQLPDIDPEETQEWLDSLEEHHHPIAGHGQAMAMAMAMEPWPWPWPWP